MVKFLTPENEVKKRSMINFGCGRDIRENWINIDIATLDGVDIVLDLENEKLPLEDNSIDKIYASHFLEHISNLGHVLQEASRVLRKGGEFEIIVPAYSSSGAFQDPTHQRFYTEITFRYFTGEYFNYYFKDVEFKLIKLRKKRSDMYKKIMKIVYPFVRIIGKRKFDMFVDSFLMNTVTQYEAILRKT